MKRTNGSDDPRGREAYTVQPGTQQAQYQSVFPRITDIVQRPGPHSFPPSRISMSRLPLCSDVGLAEPGSQINLADQIAHPGHDGRHQRCRTSAGCRPQLRDQPFHDIPAEFSSVCSSLSSRAAPARAVLFWPGSAAIPAGFVQKRDAKIAFSPENRPVTPPERTCPAVPQQWSCCVRKRPNHSSNLEIEMTRISIETTKEWRLAIVRAQYWLFGDVRLISSGEILSTVCGFPVHQPRS